MNPRTGSADPTESTEADDAAQLGTHFRELSGHYDVAVIGAGFGGLGAGLSLAERGARVVLLESLSYPGGCASTFQRGGASFESGATLFSGLGEGGLFRRWIDAYDLGVKVEWPDPVIEWRAPGIDVPLSRDRRDLESRFLEMPGAPVRGLEKFFAHQRRVADCLWSLLDEPALLPPFGLRGLAGHARRLPQTLPVLRDVGRPLASVLKRYGLEGFAPLRNLLDSICQITVQCGVEEAEAPFALATLDYVWRGTGHVRGGIGELARGLVRAIRSLGGDVCYSSRVRQIERLGGGWKLHARRGSVTADRVVANLLPHDLDCVLDPSVDRPNWLGRLAADVETGWGACMLYLVIQPDESAPRHLELVADPTKPLIEGNHIFCSMSGMNDGPKASNGCYTATVSTHVPMHRLRSLDSEERASYVAGIQERMRETLSELAPEVDARIVDSLTASPRTFERFTGRFLGYVGGVPRRAGWRQYLRLSNPEVAPGLQVVGDSVFPGQSTLAASLGGWKVAERWAQLFGQRRVSVPAASEARTRSYQAV